MMEILRHKVNEIESTPKCTQFTNSVELSAHGLTGITLHPYQLQGVTWIIQCYHNNHGCILGDEMGLGKTCQTIASLIYIKSKQTTNLPFLIICPLSVMGNWQDELSRFAPKLRVLNYHGDKVKRQEMQSTIFHLKYSKSSKVFDVLLTTYEILMKDESYLRPIEWGCLVVDEGHRLKNCESLLHVTLLQFSTRHRILLTGTPIQNNLDELYSLLSFVAPTIFRYKFRADFIAEHQMSVSSEADMSDLHKILKPFLLRRIKTDVLRDIPQKSELVFYHGLSDLQKKYYKAILLKDIDAFEKSDPGTSRTSLINIMMQLRKCVNHPYLFDGVEPEPFVLGEHLIEASGKLRLIDDLLAHLSSTGHKVLMFSQMTHMLDILQDYLGYRGYSYERLDGSVRGEERFVAVRNFNRNDSTFVFLLSTKAGGQGLNLTSADTVIFVDSDFNPQNDLQAAARAHRLGQTRPVKVIRLISKSTVEEIILKKAEEKLRLTASVIEGGQLAGDHSVLYTNNTQLQEILKFGLHEVLSNASEEMIDYVSMLGPTVDGEWQVEESSRNSVPAVPVVPVVPDVPVVPNVPVIPDVPDKMKVSDIKPKDSHKLEGEVPESMYMFEGIDYSTLRDKEAFNELVTEHREQVEQFMDQGRASRHQPVGTTTLAGLLPSIGSRRRKLSPEEIAERQRKRAETLARKQKAAELNKIAREERRNQRREQLWKQHNYVSAKITSDSEGESDHSEDDGEDNPTDYNDDGTDRRDIRYISGDVTCPSVSHGQSVIIVHCADDSGSWGVGGVFTAIDRLSPQPRTCYENAYEMQDLAVGDVHLIPLADNETSTQHLALIIAQHRDQSGTLSGIKLSALARGLKCIRKAARQNKASVHLPRIGYNTPNFNWYGTERLIRKHLSSRGVPTYIYYYPRKHSKRSTETALHSQTKVKKTDRSDGASTALSDAVTLQGLPNVFSGMTIYLHRVPDNMIKQYRRFIIAYDGDLDDAILDRTTHVVTASSPTKHDLEDLRALIGGHSHVTVVCLLWLERCIRKKHIVPTDKFTVYVD